MGYDISWDTIYTRVQSLRFYQLIRKEKVKIKKKNFNFRPKNKTKYNCIIKIKAKPISTEFLSFPLKKEFI